MHNSSYFSDNLYLNVRTHDMKYVSYNATGKFTCIQVPNQLRFSYESSLRNWKPLEARYLLWEDLVLGRDDERELLGL